MKILKLITCVIVALVMGCAFSAQAMDGNGNNFQTSNADLPFEGYYYEVLGLPNYASLTPSTLKRAYKKAALSHHPSTGGRTGGSKEAFQNLSQARDFFCTKDQNGNFDYNTIDQRKKSDYDMWLFAHQMPWNLINKWTVTPVMILSAIYSALWLKKYAEQQGKLIDSMQEAASQAMTMLLAFEFDRYSPTKETDGLLVQFDQDIQTLISSVPSEDVRVRLEKSIAAFDKTLERLYEKCAWQYYGRKQDLMREEGKLVSELLINHATLKSAIEMARKDLGLDRSYAAKAKIFAKKHGKKIAGTSIGACVAGGLCWLMKNVDFAQKPMPQPGVMPLVIYA